MNKARRGELLFNLPIGYVRRLNGEVDLDPDEEVQRVVHLIFKKFEELKTLNATLQYLVKNNIQIGVQAYSGISKGELEWHRPNRMTLQNMLKNPMYAGVYAYGRRKVDPRRKIAGRPSTGRTVVSLENCDVVLKDRFVSYISLEQYERNRDQLKQNRSSFDSKGSVRQGASLLSGLLVCKKCGYRMTVRYSRDGRHQYMCDRLLVDYGGKLCQSLAGPPLDDFITKQVLEILKPASLELSLEASKNIEGERTEIDKLWQNRLERSRYASERAARQYQAVEPENRLVARQLEHEWEEKLKEQKKVEEEYARFQMKQPRLLSKKERDAIRELASDIPALWNDSSTSIMDRKEIIRQIIDKILIDVINTTEIVKISIQWVGGTVSETEMIKPVAKLEQLSYYQELFDTVKKLAEQGIRSEKIAEELNKRGWRPPKRAEKFNSEIVGGLINRYGLRKSSSYTIKEDIPLGKDEWLLSKLAIELDMPRVTLDHWIRRGQLKARIYQKKRRHWIIWANKMEVERLRKLRDNPLKDRARERWLRGISPPIN
ncbi:MAG: recombinase family protein [bacterium]